MYSKCLLCIILTSKKKFFIAQTRIRGYEQGEETAATRSLRTQTRSAEFFRHEFGARKRGTRPQQPDHTNKTDTWGRDRDRKHIIRDHKQIETNTRQATAKLAARKQYYYNSIVIIITINDEYPSLCHRQLYRIRRIMF